MVTEIKNSEQPMTYYDIFIELLHKSGSSIAGAGGSLAVVLTYTADLAQWVGIFGGALGLVAGVLGVYSKWQEIKFRALQMSDFQKSTERDAIMYDKMKEANQVAVITNEVLNKIK